MKKLIINLFSTLLFLSFISCNKTQETKTKTSTISEQEENSTKKKTPDIQTYYISAANGLVMREGPNLEANKVKVIDYGAAIQVFIKDTSAVPPVGGMIGKMVKVIHGQDKGYMFDGYLSSIPVPLEGQSTNEYINSLKKKSLLAEEGWKDEAEFVSIPAANFQEALLIVQHLGLLQITFDIPVKSAKQLKFIFNNQNNTAERDLEYLVDGEYIFRTSEVNSGNQNSMDASYYFFNIKFTDGDLGYKKLSVSTAYEGGSWSCALEQQKDNYVFIKTSNID